MDKLDFLPLGSTVVIKGESKWKVVIIARGLALRVDNEMRFFDYGGCLYPVGLFGNNILYFNREDINDVLQKGYSDLEDETQIENINKWLYEHSMKRGDVSEMKERFERNRDA